MISRLQLDFGVVIATFIRRWPVVAILSIAMLGMALTTTASGPLNTGYNPDQPLFGHIEESTYLQLRDEHIALLRGLPYPQPDARMRAIQQFQQSVASVDTPMLVPFWSPLGP